MTPPPTRRVRCWRRLVGYPHLGARYRSSDNRALLAGLRASIRLLTLGLLGVVALLVAGLAGYPVPGWGVPLLTATGALVMPVIQPQMRDSLLSLHLAHLRGEEWAQEWTDAGVPYRHLWRMATHPPVPLETYAAYHQALRSDDDTSTDPRLVWWLHVHGIGPDLAARYRQADVPAEVIPAVTALGVTPEQWGSAPSLYRSQPRALLRALAWLLTGPGSRRPAALLAAEARGCAADALAALNQWSRVGLLPGAWQEVCAAASTRAMPKPCEGCDDGPGRHLPLAATQTFAQHTVRSWVEAAGMLAPWFIAARIPLAEAEAMIAADPTAVTPEALATLAALRA